MKKAKMGITNNFCPQTLFIYGTYKEDGTPDFGLFCWFSYVWDDKLGVMACIGGDKLTKDNIRRNKVFSANLVNEPLLPLADYYGNVSGYNEAKMKKMPKITEGTELNVPILCDSPVSYELEVSQEINLNGSDVFICQIKNVLCYEYLMDEGISLQERVKRVQPVFTTHQTYFRADAEEMGGWGDALNELGDEYDKGAAALVRD
jgi:flavin reductase (DIM6/NTAB) family NADH-FMN oxidoreductase RutF